MVHVVEWYTLTKTGQNYIMDDVIEFMEKNFPEIEKFLEKM